MQCYKLFTNRQNVESTSKLRSCSVVSNKDDALKEVVSAIRLNPKKISIEKSSIEVHTLYIKMGGIESNGHVFMFRLKQDMKDEIMFLISPGTATNIMLTDKAESILKFEKDNDEDNSFAQINFVAKKIVSKTKS